MKRKCGECSICCYIGYIPELEKPTHQWCKNVKTKSCGSCAIHDSKDLPKTCNDYKCLWLRGYGGDGDRPDDAGVLFSDNVIEEQRYFTAIETKEGALDGGGGLKTALEIARAYPIPMLVVDYGQKPPTTGDRVIIHDKILHRAKRIAGELLVKHDDVGIYELLKGN
ncbi:MAG: hypothetical protein ACR2PH_09760 [Desulfobulbia bacterium]